MTILAVLLGEGGNRRSKLPAPCTLHSKLDTFFATKLKSENYTQL